MVKSHEKGNIQSFPYFLAGSDVQHTHTHARTHTHTPISSISCWQDEDKLTWALSAEMEEPNGSLGDHFKYLDWDTIKECLPLFCR